MKYLITKTDISLNGKIHSEGSVIDSTNFSKEDLESVSHFLVPVEKSSEFVTLDTTVKDNSAVKIVETQLTKRNRKPKSTN